MFRQVWCEHVPPACLHLTFFIVIVKMNLADTSGKDSNVTPFLNDIGEISALNFDNQDNNESLDGGKPASASMSPRLSIDGLQIRPLITNLEVENEQKDGECKSDDDWTNSVSNNRDCLQPSKKLVWDKQKKEASDCNGPNSSLEWIESNQEATMLFSLADSMILMNQAEQGYMLILSSLEKQGVHDSTSTFLSLFGLGSTLSTKFIDNKVGMLALECMGFIAELITLCLQNWGFKCLIKHSSFNSRLMCTIC